MSQKDKELDEFWDLSSLVPKSKITHNSSRSSKPIGGVEVAFSTKEERTDGDGSPTVIKRYINPLHDERKKIKKEAFSSAEAYIPEGSLLHSVTLRKRKSQYELYSDFICDALEHLSLNAVETEYTSFFSYVPQYNQLTEAQSAYYLWWRECFKKGIYIKTDLSYVLLYIYELINLGDKINVLISQQQLAELWNVYHKEFSSISGKLAIWICDFSLMHKLPPPENIGTNILKYTTSLKEFYIHIPKDDYGACVASLLKYGTEYNYRASKFATEKNLAFFDKHIFGAMLTAVKFFSVDGRILSGLASEDSRLVRNAFDGALCASEWRYEIEVKYCSFSRSNELRFIMGDIVKYSENKIRGFLGVKSKLSVYSIGQELQRALDAYFVRAFAEEAPISKKKSEAATEYDILYDNPTRPLSLENAKKIENDSWMTTNDLVSAFVEEGTQEESSPHELLENIPQENNVDVDTALDIMTALGEYRDFALAIKNQDFVRVEQIAKEKGNLVESIIDMVNEIAVDILGDILIEDNGMGFEIVECYRDLI